MQLDMTRKLLGDREFFRQLATRARAHARDLGKLIGLKVIEDETGFPMSTLSQAFSGERGRDVPLGLLPYLAAHDPDRKLGDAIAKFWNCKLTPLPRRSPVEERLIEELQAFGDKGREAIERVIGEER
jgi:hypothetical protein